MTNIYTQESVKELRGVEINKAQYQTAIKVLDSKIRRRSHENPLKGVWTPHEKELRFNIGEGSVSVIENGNGGYVLFTSNVSEKERSRLLRRIQ